MDNFKKFQKQVSEDEIVRLTGIYTDGIQTELCKIIINDESGIGTINNKVKSYTKKDLVWTWQPNNYPCYTSKNLCVIQYPESTIIYEKL